MSITIVRTGDSGSGLVASGVSFNWPVNPAAGNAVLLAINSSGATTGFTLSGLGASWQPVGPVVAVTGGSTQMWLGLNANGTTKAITVSDVGAHGYIAAGIELSGAGYARSNGSATGTSTAPAALFTTPPSGAVLFSYCGTGAQNTTAGPTGRWTNYNANFWQPAGGKDNNVSYQLASDTTSQTATWTSPSTAWVTNGCLVFPQAGLLSMLTGG